MPNLGAVLKTEIARLARKEIKSQVDPLKKTNASYRRDIAELKRQIASLERALKNFGKVNQKKSEEAEGVTTRFTAKGLRSLRSKLGLSAADFGKLAGVSAQSIYHWEAGKTTPRKSQQSALAGLRGMGKREVKARLVAMSGSR